MESSNYKTNDQAEVIGSADLVGKHGLILNYLLVYLLLFVSGSWLYQLSPTKILVLSFTASLLVWVLLSDRKLSDRLVLYVVMFSGFLLMINLYTGGSLSLSSIFATTMKLLLAYFIVKKVGSGFIETYIKVVVFLAGFSLFGYMSDTFLLFDSVVTKFPRVGEIGFEGIFYVFRFWEHIDRNNSIFFEPGAYQIFLNAAIFMLIFVNIEISSMKRWVYLTILVMTLVSTFSTTGYLIFAAMFVLFLLVSRDLSTSYKVLMVGVLFFALAIFSTQFYSVIFYKIDSVLSTQAITDGSDRRGLDALVDMEIFKMHLFGVGHEKYTELFSATGHIDSEFSASSNGITGTLAIYGLPFSLFLFSSYYWALRRLLGKGLMSFVPFGMLMMFFVGESYYVFSPICMAIIAAAFVYNQLPINEGSGGQNEAVT